MNPYPTPERPAERTRNAKAQARFRAKRKAYIEQLENTVAKLQIAYNIGHEEIAILPPPSRRFQQLSEENARLIRENSELRAALADYEQGRTPSVVPAQQTSTANASTSIMGGGPERKKRRLEDTGLCLFTPESAAGRASIAPDSEPSPASRLMGNHSYPSGSSESPSSYGTSGFSSYQYPHTPSSSSGSNSTPPYSPFEYTLPPHPPRVAQHEYNLDPNPASVHCSTSHPFGSNFGRPGSSGTGMGHPPTSRASAVKVEEDALDFLPPMQPLSMMGRSNPRNSAFMQQPFISSSGYLEPSNTSHTLSDWHAGYPSPNPLNTSR
ncbi:hypothetical protein CYLTODRAFT_491332 [Cylindrobasidium torrendii FP15055 ss-10]|uniref:BZIP domain-containing protein n=1 Tax=Cylindrobasidium torrendii FP15055 ss-10 TaxID=1314674 RepID=A0A0D7B8V3_9AGAR|nr:hypothetical protein CYLTODRAFT_491332 [Cylindrobasidium torrendii FP15055 ss-10]